MANQIDREALIERLMHAALYFRDGVRSVKWGELDDWQRAEGSDEYPPKKLEGELKADITAIVDEVIHARAA